MLLEALIAILIFSLGVLALVGLQTVSIRQSSEAGYRAEALMFANEIIGQMWVDNRSFANLSANYAHRRRPPTTPGRHASRTRTCRAPRPTRPTSRPRRLALRPTRARW